VQWDFNNTLAPTTSNSASIRTLEGAESYIWDDDLAKFVLQPSEVNNYFLKSIIFACA
jgi:hypothetical protein